MVVVEFNLLVVLVLELWCLCIVGVANGKSETRRDAKTGILKSKPETKKCTCTDLIEKHICDREKQNLRLRDPLVGSARFRDLDGICRRLSFFGGPFTTPYSWSWSQ